MTARPVQMSMMPDVSPDRPVGKIPPSVMVGTNADLIAALADLYLAGSVCDVTYGLGKWWDRYRPAELVAHDIDTEKGDGVDFTALPEPNNTYDAVCFDPPYIPQGGVKDAAVGQRFRRGFGLVQRSEAVLWELIESGLSESARVSRGFVLVKCMDFVNGGGLTLGHVRMIEAGARHGLDVHDLIVHHTGSGPGGHNIFTAKRARRHHSYLLVFTKRRETA